MKIGIPGGLFYYRYKGFIDTFVEELGAERVYSPKSSKRILDRGIEHCVDEACLPIKIFNGHVNTLADNVNAIFVPRIMNCEFGESICPKICGLPELSEKSANKTKLAFTYPLHISDKRAVLKSLTQGGKELGFAKSKIKKAALEAEKAHSADKKGIRDTQYKYTVFLAGHSYNIYDDFANMDIISKLHKLDIGVISEDALPIKSGDLPLRGLIKNPYWLYFRRNYGAAMHLIQTGAISGIIYLSSFNCGIDSIVVELIKNNAGDCPVLVLKLDEQSGEAGLMTRILAFGDILRAKSL